MVAVAPKPLTPKQLRFVHEYMIDLNATQAAIRAGYSKRTAQEQSSRLLSKAMVQEEIKRRQAELAAKFRITQEKVVAEMAKIGFSNMGDYLKCSEGGDPYFDYASLTREQKAALEEVTVESSIKGKDELVKKIKFRLHDKLAALEKLGRHLGMFKEGGERGSYGGGVDQALIREFGRLFLERQRKVKVLDI
jgi:phage terminase small subunit